MAGNGQQSDINNGLLINFGQAISSSNRWFTFPCAFSSYYCVNVTSITPVGFDNYKCVSYVWVDGNLAQAHIITTSQHTPGVHIIAIGV